MNDETGNRIQSGKPADNGGEQPLSGREILIVLAIIALVCAVGYFLLLKLIDVSRQDDCILAHRRNCATEAPFNR